MHESKAGPARPFFWCGVQTAEKQAVAPDGARTVRGPYTAFSLANSQRSKPAMRAGKGRGDGQGHKED
jgi:hypothetical protein